MNIQERIDLVKMLRGLTLKLEEISQVTEDIVAQDELGELIDVIDDSVTQLMANTHKEDSQ